MPIELNLKYALKITPEMTIDIGADGSANYGKLEESSLLGSYGENGCEAESEKALPFIIFIGHYYR